MKMNTDALRSWKTTRKQKGFTIVELIVVVVVLVILALVVIVLYDQVAVKGNDAVLKSDIESNMKLLEQDFSRDRDYPATAAEANDGKGLVASSGTTLDYYKKPYGYCLTATNPDATTMVRIRSVDGEIVEGDCEPEAVLIAGPTTSTSGFADGNGTAARFYQIEGITVSPTNGDIYVGDYGNHRIRKITGGGEVSTVVGNGVNSCTAGVGTAAVIGRPHGVAFDSSGNLFAMGCSGARLVKITPDGTMSMLAGGGASSCNGTGTGAQFYWSRGIAIDQTDTIFVGATELWRVCKVTQAGVVTTLAGGTRGFAEGTGAAAQFDWPWAIAVDKYGTIYVGDQDNARIRKVTQAGVVTTLSGAGTVGASDGPAATATYSSDFEGIALDPTGEILYVADLGRIRSVSTATGDVTSTYFTWPSATFPTQIAVGPDGVLYGATNYAVIKLYM